MGTGAKLRKRQCQFVAAAPRSKAMANAQYYLGSMMTTAQGRQRRNYK